MALHKRNIFNAKILLKDLYARLIFYNVKYNCVLLNPVPF